MPEIWSALASDETLLELEPRFSDAGEAMQTAPLSRLGKGLMRAACLGSLSNHCVFPAVALGLERLSMPSGPWVGSHITTTAPVPCAGCGGWSSQMSRSPAAVSSVSEGPWIHCGAGSTFGTQRVHQTEPAGPHQETGLGQNTGEPWERGRGPREGEAASAHGMQGRTPRELPGLGERHSLQQA